jgi:hypothetical protein
MDVGDVWVGVTVGVGVNVAVSVDVAVGGISVEDGVGRMGVAVMVGNGVRVGKAGVGEDPHALNITDENPQRSKIDLIDFFITKIPYSDHSIDEVKPKLSIFLPMSESTGT